MSAPQSCDISADQFPVEPKYFPFQAIRLVATALLFLIPVAAGINRMGLIAMAIFLTFIDTVDCPWKSIVFVQWIGVVPMH
jgi:hypothetical protein